MPLFFSPIQIQPTKNPANLCVAWRVLRTQSLLFSLDLSSNEISDLGASALLKALEENFVLLEPWAMRKNTGCLAEILVKNMQKKHVKKHVKRCETM